MGFIYYKKMYQLHKKRHLKYKMLNMMITLTDIRGHFTQVIAIFCKVFTSFIAQTQIMFIATKHNHGTDTQTHKT